MCTYTISTTFYVTNWSVFRPVIELTIPSSVDRSIVDKEGTHVGLIFSQYTPYQLADGRKWDEDAKNEYAKNGIL